MSSDRSPPSHLEGDKPTCIHKHLLRVYGEACVDVSTVWWWVRWIKGAETGGVALHKKLCSDCTCTTLMPLYIHWVDEMISGNLCTTTDEVCSIPSISKGSVMAFLEELSYSKVCGIWVPPVLTDARKRTRKAIVTACWHQYSNWKWGLPLADCHGEWKHSEPESKGQLWNGAIQHPQGRRNSRVRCKLEKSWSESSGMRRMCSFELLA